MDGTEIDSGQKAGKPAEPGTATSHPELAAFDIMRVMAMLPHRYPMLMIDRLTEIVPGESATGIKNVTFNEPHFQGHFPQRPVMPGVLVVEAMAQTAGALVVYSLGGSAEGKMVYFMSIDEARFRKPIVPGDTVRIHVQKLRQLGTVWRFKGEARVDGALCAEAVYTAKIFDT